MKNKLPSRVSIKEQLQSSYPNLPVECKDEYWRDQERITIVEYKEPTSYFFEGKELNVSAEYLVGYTKHLERKLNNPRIINNATKEFVEKIIKELDFINKLIK